MVNVNSARRMSSTRSTPSCPNADKPQIYGRTPNPDRPRSRRQGFVDIRSATEASVNEHGNPPADGINHFGQAVDRRTQGLAGAPAVIRDDETVHAMIDGQPRVVGAVDAFE
jgi:hypothetical protein